MIYHKYILQNVVNLMKQKNISLEQLYDAMNVRTSHRFKPDKHSDETDCVRTVANEGVTYKELMRLCKLFDCEPTAIVGKNATDTLCEFTT